MLFLFDLISLYYNEAWKLKSLIEIEAWCGLKALIRVAKARSYSPEEYILYSVNRRRL
jgi:hypothetical protein